MGKEKEANDNHMNIELAEEIAEGMYSNLAIISHSNAEFVMDFIRVLPGLPKAKVKSRIIMTPQHAKRLMLALQDNVQKYEANYGTIDIKEMEHNINPMGGFSGPGGMA